jgi:hypothetical protein
MKSIVTPAPGWAVATAVACAVLCSWYVHWYDLESGRTALHRLPLWLDFILSCLGVRVNNIAAAWPFLCNVIAYVVACCVPTVLLLTWNRLVKLSFKAMLHPEHRTFMRTNTVTVIWRQFVAWGADLTTEFLDTVGGIVVALIPLASFGVLTLFDGPLSPNANCNAAHVKEATRAADYFASEIKNATLWSTPIGASGATLPAHFVLSALQQAPTLFSQYNSVTNAKGYAASLKLGQADMRWVHFSVICAVLSSAMAAYNRLSRDYNLLPKMLATVTVFNEQLICVRDDSLLPWYVFVRRMVLVGTPVVTLLGTFLTVWNSMNALHMYIVLYHYFPLAGTFGSLTRICAMPVFLGLVVVTIRYVLMLVVGIQRSQLSPNGLLYSRLQALTRVAEEEERRTLCLTENANIESRITPQDICIANCFVAGDCTEWLNDFVGACERRAAEMSLLSLLDRTFKRTRYMITGVRVLGIATICMHVMLIALSTWCYIWMAHVLCTSIVLDKLRQSELGSLYLIASAFPSQIKSLYGLTVPSPLAWSLGARMQSIAARTNCILRCTEEAGIFSHIRPLLKAAVSVEPPSEFWRTMLWLTGVLLLCVVCISFVAGAIVSHIWSTCKLEWYYSVTSHPLQEMMKLCSQEVKQHASVEELMGLWSRIALQYRLLPYNGIDRIEKLLSGTLDMVDAGAIILHFLETEAAHCDNNWLQCLASIHLYQRLGPNTMHPSASSALEWLVYRHRPPGSVRDPRNQFIGMRASQVATAFPASALLYNVTLQQLPRGRPLLGGHRVSPGKAPHLPPNYLTHMYGNGYEWSAMQHPYHLLAFDEFVSMCLIPLATYIHQRNPVVRNSTTSRRVITSRAWSEQEEMELLEVLRGCLLHLESITGSDDDVHTLNNFYGVNHQLEVRVQTGDEAAAATLQHRRHMEQIADDLHMELDSCIRTVYGAIEERRHFLLFSRLDDAERCGRWNTRKAAVLAWVQEQQQ